MGLFELKTEESLITLILVLLLAAAAAGLGPYILRLFELIEALFS